MFWQRLSASFRLLILTLLFVSGVGPEWPTFQEERYRLETFTRPRQFDFLVWEANALWQKGTAALTAGSAYLDETTGKELVVRYLTLTGETRQLERDVNALYADPSVIDPAAAAAPLQATATANRRQLADWQPLVEAIVEEQVAAVLIEQGFGILGRVWPPVQAHVTPLPLALIVSPRHEIRQLYNISLEHGLAVPFQEELETTIYDNLDRSALVTPIGGVGIYPAMILETSDVNYLAEVVAHEWAHHWLTLRPLGASYAASPTLRTLNETVASLFGKEVGPLVVARYYPELAPPPETAAPPEPAPPAERPAFDFRAEMRQTRVRVDELLAQGRIEEAEQYMEERRQFFVANGYSIRKLNQAYFAFYGAY
ncbi:MAG: hypothetical protein AB1791_23430, partial [Chloroflexota bacterium]